MLLNIHFFHQHSYLNIHILFLNCQKLLLTHKELVKVERKVKESGLTIIPVRVFLNEKGYAKLRIALARGKKEYDKRESLKLKDAKKDMDRAMKR